MADKYPTLMSSFDPNQAALAEVPGGAAGRRDAAGAKSGTAQAQAQGGAMAAKWRAMAPRERTLVLVAGLVLGGFLLWSLAIQPALRTMGTAPARLAELDTQWLQMQRMAAEAKELRGTPRMLPTQSQAALKAATDALGQAARLQVIGDRATLTLTNASGDQVKRWLVEARSTARVRPLEANLNRGATGFSGNIIVALPAP
jgi:general secretion pathway protein M